MTSTAIEKVLSDIHRLLGETPEAAGAMQELRALSANLNDPTSVHSMTRLLLALKRADAATYARGYADAVSDYEENGEDDVLASRDNEEEP